MLRPGVPRSIDEKGNGRVFQSKVARAEAMRGRPARMTQKTDMLNEKGDSEEMLARTAQCAEGYVCSLTPGVAV